MNTYYNSKDDIKNIEIKDSNNNLHVQIDLTDVIDTLIDADERNDKTTIIIKTKDSKYDY